jgi:hypothetical protein
LVLQKKERLHGESKQIVRHRNIINYIKAQRFNWFDHLQRMPEERILKKVYKCKSMIRRPLGRPKNRWEDYIRNDMKKLEIKNWTNCIQDRNNVKMYNKTSIKRNILTIKKIHQEVGRAKDLSAPLYHKIHSVFSLLSRQDLVSYGA